MDRIDVALDTNRWLVLVNIVMKIRVPKQEGHFLTSCGDIGF